jgi:nitrite reductase/ring-hydroxylating ferredoxin subunit
MSVAQSRSGRRPTPLEPVLDLVEGAAALDQPGKAIGKLVRKALAPPKLKETLSGTWLGHALHPLLTDVVVGSFMSATLLDLLGGDDDGRASRRLIGVGIAAYPVTALTGVNDWADTEAADDGVRRTGLIHAVTNAAALSLYVSSLAARRKGAHGRGRLLGVGGATVLAAGGYLGGHLSFAKGVGPDQTVFDSGPDDWTPVQDAGELPEGRPTRAVAADTPVLLLRRGEEILAIHDRCSHRGCSLANGEVEGDHVTCACHGSRFDLRNGALLRGPATAPQPAFEVRRSGDRLELRRSAPAA